MNYDPQVVNDFANFLALTAGIPAFLFTLVYGFASPWYKSWLGRTLFGLMFSISLLFAVILARRFFGTYPGYEWVAVVSYTCLAVAFWSFFIILLVERRASHQFEIQLSRKDTQPHAIITPDVRVTEERKEPRMKNFASWFTPERRQKIQAALITLVPLAVMFGYGTDGQWEQILIITGAVLAGVAGLLNLLNVRVQDWATQGWAIVRGVVYAAATAISPALMLLGFYNEDVNTRIVTGISIALTALSSAIAIFASGQQQKVAAIEGETREAYRRRTDGF
jgi:hypothetical protein